MKRILGIVTALLLSGSCAAQSLFAQPPLPALAGEDLHEVNAELALVSLTYVPPPKPKKFKRHDLVTIIIDETSRASSSQSLDTKKDYNLSARLSKFPSLAALLDAQLEGGANDNPAELGVTSNQKFKGDGKYDRSDRFSARITAEIIDVKPNGVLVLEARKSIQRDKESTTLILSGKCRTDDVTNANTILSSQLADLAVNSQNEGQVKDTATKGWIPRVLEAIFNF